MANIISIYRKLPTSQSCIAHLEKVRIRRDMVDNSELLTGIIEMDETYVGGKPRRFDKNDDD